MISVSESFKNAVSGDGRTFRARFIDSNGEEITCDIYSIVRYTGASGDGIYPGAAFAPYITGTLNSVGVLSSGTKFTLEIGIVTDRAKDTVEWIKWGVYTVTEAPTTAYAMTFTAVGNLSMDCNSVYTPTVSFPATVASVIADLQTQCGHTITLKGLSASGSIQTKPTAATIRDMLVVVSGILGGFVTEDHTGNFVIAKYGSGDTFETNGDRASEEPALNSDDFKVTGIKCKVSDSYSDENGTEHAAVSYSTGVVNVEYENKYMTEALFNAMYPNILGYTCRGGTVEMSLGDPRLEPWDEVSVTDLKGNTFKVPCLAITQTFDGGLSTEVTANIQTASAGTAYVRGSLSNAVNQLTAEMLSANVAIANRVTTKDFEANNAAVSGQLSANSASIASLTANKADIDLANVKEASVKEALIDDAAITTAKIADAAITGAKIADATITDAKINDLNASKITAGDISADRMEANVITAVNTYTGTSVIDQAKIGDLDASKITAGDISADRMTANAIKAINADVTTATINAAHIGDLSADKITSGDISSDRISANVINAVNSYTGTAVISAAKISDLDASKITSGDISADRMTANSITAINSYTGTATIDTAHIGNLDASKITSGDIGANRIKTNVITAINSYTGTATIDSAHIGDISADKITSGTINGNNVTISNLTASSITVAKINGQSVTGSGDLQTVLGTVSTAIDGNAEDISSTLKVANDALKSANSKNTVYYSDTEPSGGSPGDIWFDTANDNAIHIYEGGTWGIAQLGNTAIMAGLDAGKITVGQLDGGLITASTITGDKIAADTIAASSIAADTLVSDNALISAIQSSAVRTASLDASQITTGTLDANRIASGSITIQQMASDVTGRLDKIDTWSDSNGNISGSAIASGTISSSQIQDNSIGTSQLSNDVIEALEYSGKYIRMEDGVITIGESGSAYKITLSQDGLRLYADNVDVAKFLTAVMQITDARVISSLRFGAEDKASDFAFVPQANGDLSFLKVVDQ